MSQATFLEPAEFERRKKVRQETPIPVLGGFVQLVDVMGDEQDICEAARVTSQQDAKTLGEDYGLIRYLMRHRHCYDAATEVLTDRGFMPWPEAVKHNPSELALGTWDPVAQSLVYEEPEYFTDDPYCGPMYVVDHGGVSLVVTPDHKMWVQVGRGKDAPQDFGLIPANELGDRSCVRYTKLAPYRGQVDDFDLYDLTQSDVPVGDQRAFLRFAGFFIGDGSVSKTSTNCVEFRLKKRRKRTFLAELCLELGWEFRELTGPNISVHAPGLGQLCRKLFYDEQQNKQIPETIRHCNVEDSQALLDGLRNSDGTAKRSTWEYTTAVASLAEHVQLVALHAGEAAHINTRDNGMFGVMFLSRMREPVINQGSCNTRTEAYDGRVYCAKTRTGILVVRRNGKIVLSGNTTPLEMVELKFRVKVAMDTWRQWIRHRTASVNEYSTRYSPAIDEAQTTLPGEWRIQSISNRQGSSGEVVSAWPAGYEIFVLSEDGQPAVTVADHEYPEYDHFGVFKMDLDHPQDFSYAELLYVHRGAYEALTPGYFLTQMELAGHSGAREHYNMLLSFGVAKEQARKDLPLSTMTMAIWKIDLHNLLHFLSLRMDSHAQLEIRSYANAIGMIVEQIYPVVWEAFKQYRLNAMQLTELDIGVIAKLTETAKSAATDDTALGRTIGIDEVPSYLPPYHKDAFLLACPPQWHGERSRERDECLAKLRKLGLVQADAAA